MTQATVKLLFGTPLLIARLDDADLNRELEESILARRAGHAGFTRHNRGGWQSDMKFLDWGGSAARRLALLIADLADGATRDARPRAPERQNWIIQAWANVNEAGAVNLPHGHTGTSGCYWSAVYYVRCIEGAGGELLLYDPRGPMVSMHARHLFLENAGPEREVNLKPRTGMLVMFPSWLFHAVNPYHGDEPRISVAMNLSVRPAANVNETAIETLRADSVECALQ